MTKTSKTLTLALIASSTVLFGAATASACGPYVQVDVEQQQISRLFVRINKGSRDGSLTQWEADQLNDMATRAQNRYTRFASDGYIDNRESRRLSRTISKTSRRIQRLRNNDVRVHNNVRVHVHHGRHQNTRFQKRHNRKNGRVGLNVSWR
mgnify:CR=1 FL=1